MKLGWYTWTYLGAVTLVAGGLIAYWFHVWPTPVLPTGSLPALFVALAVIAQHFQLSVGPKRKVDASISVYFAGLLLFGAAMAVALAAVGQILGQSTLALRRNPSTGRRRRAAPDVIFNTSQLVLATGLGSLVYFAFLPYQAPAPFERIENLWALPATAATMYLSNSVAVAVIVGLQLKRDPFRVWLSGRWTHTLEFAGLFLCGLLTAIATRQAAWAPLAMLLLITILFRSLQRTVQLRSQEQELRVEAQNTAENVRRLQEVIAHDLRQPLTLTFGHITLLREMLRRRNGFASELRTVDQAARSARRLSRMIDELVDSSQLETERLTLQRQEVDLPALVRAVMDRMGPVAGGREVRLEVTGEGRPIAVDPNRIEQVLRNLLTNAGKYSFPGSQIVVAVDQRPGESEVRVTNEGPGIAPGNLTRLFSGYRRVAEPGTAPVDSVGLGLSIAKWLVELHGGRIWVESIPDQTTTFYFTVPHSEVQ